MAKKIWPELRPFAHRLVEEPIEFWAAMAFYFAMLAMWTAARGERQEATPK